MAKRTRGSTSRPGQRPPLQRQPVRRSAPAPSATTTPVARPAGLTPQEEARAAELEAAIVADERQAQEQVHQTKAARVSPAPRMASTLESSAASEYAYVARDVRRIAIVGGSLFAIMIGLWIVSQLVGPIAF
jgi:hypothetical protein